MSPRPRTHDAAARLREQLDAERRTTATLREQVAAYRVAMNEQAGAVDRVKKELEAMRAELVAARHVEAVCRRFVAGLRDVMAVCELNPEGGEHA